jgi:hypothetical protein
MENINVPQLEAIMRPLPNIDIVEAKVPFDVLKILQEEIENPSQELIDNNDQLLGHLQEEYKLDHISDQISDYIIQVAQYWHSESPGLIETEEEVRKCNEYEFELSGLWFNKQKKHEFNPVHHHSGVISFVIWINIPYDLAEEEKLFPEVSENYTSKFTFHYNDILGRTRQMALPVDKTWEGMMLMFPSKLHHSVYPFYTSDEKRISVSGNISIKAKE